MLPLLLRLTHCISSPFSCPTALCVCSFLAIRSVLLAVLTVPAPLATRFRCGVNGKSSLLLLPNFRYPTAAVALNTLSTSRCGLFCPITLTETNPVLEIYSSNYFCYSVSCCSDCSLLSVLTHDPLLSLDMLLVLPVFPCPALTNYLRPYPFVSFLRVLASPLLVMLAALVHTLLVLLAFLTISALTALSYDSGNSSHFVFVLSDCARTSILPVARLARVAPMLSNPQHDYHPRPNPQTEYCFPEPSLHVACRLPVWRKCASAPAKPSATRKNDSTS